MTVPSRNASHRESAVSVSGGRRRFTVEYKTRIVQEAAQCRAVGEIGSLLRREVLFSSQLTTWLKQSPRGRATGALAAARAETPRGH